MRLLFKDAGTQPSAIGERSWLPLQRHAVDSLSTQVTRGQVDASESLRGPQPCWSRTGGPQDQELWSPDLCVAVAGGRGTTHGAKAQLPGARDTSVISSPDSTVPEGAGATAAILGGGCTMSSSLFVMRLYDLALFIFNLVPYSWAKLAFRVGFSLNYLRRSVNSALFQGTPVHSHQK